MKFKDKSIFAQRLITARRCKGMIQPDLADAIGTGVNIVCAWENDKFFPRIENLISISDALGVSIDWLVGRTNEGGPKCEFPT